MFKTLTKTLAAATIALTSAAVPASAQTDEELLAKILAGAAILGITAKVIDDRKEKKETARERAQKARGQSSAAVGDWRGPKGRVIDGEIRRYDHAGKGKGKKVRNRPLPRQCRVIVDTPRGDRVGYGSRCLNRNYDAARHLPRSCEIIVRTNHGLRGVYGERCLARDGWKTARR